MILDVVFNHFDVDSSTTPSLSMWCFDGPCDGGGIFFSPEPATPWGPRPAFGVDQVHDLILDAIASWQINYRVDGFRWDSVIAIRDTSLDGTGTQIAEGARILKDANVAIHARNPTPSRSPRTCRAGAPSRIPSMAASSMTTAAVSASTPSGTTGSSTT